MPKLQQEKLKNSTSLIALNFMYFLQKAQRMISLIFLPAHQIFPVSYHNRWFKRREFHELIEIAQEIVTEAKAMQGVANKLKTKKHVVYATTHAESTRSNSKREIVATTKDIHKMETEATLHLEQGQTQLSLLASAFAISVQCLCQNLMEEENHISF